MLLDYGVWIVRAICPVSGDGGVCVDVLSLPRRGAQSVADFYACRGHRALVGVDEELQALEQELAELAATWVESSRTWVVPACSAVGGIRSVTRAEAHLMSRSTIVEGHSTMNKKDNSD